MSSITYQNDLKFLYEKLLEHPLFVRERDRRNAFQSLYDGVCRKQDTFEDFVDGMTALTGFFCDGHTNIELPYTVQDKCLNISCTWVDGRLFLSQKYEDMESGAEILTIENRTIDEIVSSMSNRISHENIYLLKSRMINYPYKNYHVFSGMNLNALFGDKESYEICFLVQGKRIQKACYLENYNGFLDFRDESNFVSYEIAGETAVLHLDSCICNETYRNLLDELADVCAERKLKSLILDLSKNMGGSSSVIDEFISHIDIDEYRRYEMIDYSQGAAEYITNRQEIVKNVKRENCFPSELYCQISHDTFSSARTFAVTLKDNAIAKIIGEPTGGKPSSFGLPKRYKTPDHGIAFRVSRCCFLRPNAEGDQDISLFPDSEVRM